MSESLPASPTYDSDHAKCIEVAYGRGRPVDSYKTIVSIDDDDGQ